MIRSLLVFPLVFFWQSMPMGPVFPVSGGSCAPPTMTYRWAADNASNVCGTSGGSSCTTNGQAVYSLADSVSGDTATQTSSAHQAAYETNVQDGQPGIYFTQSNSVYSLNAAIAQGSTATMTWYFIVKETVINAETEYLAAGSSGGASFVPSLTTTPTLSAKDASVGTIATSSTSLPVNTAYTLVMTYNVSTKAYSLQACSLGICTVQTSGTGTLSKSGSESVGQLGAGASGYYFTGYLLEAGYSTSIDGNPSADIGAWSYCQYGI